MPVLPAPPAPSSGASADDVVAWVREHLGDLAREGADGVRPGVVRGGQAAADAALAGLDIGGYARSRSTVLPESRRGATRMSPYIRHGLLTLPEVWDAVADAPGGDKKRYRDELLWQEYARHLYARTGTALGWSLRREQPRPEPWPEPLRRDMACNDFLVTSLTEDGWLVNQTRMWLASQWSVRAGGQWRAGEDAMFAHLLDGSRAANRLGWQWTIGTGSGKPYGFSRWQVEKRAPALCQGCALRDACPIQDWPEAEPGPWLDDQPDLGKAPVPGGPDEVEGSGGEVVWLTAESLGTGDPALAADPDRPAVFCFDDPLLRRLELSGKRLVFLAECLGDLAAERDVEVRRGAVATELAGRPLASTYAPVPGWGRHREQLDVVEVHPWPWLVRPRTASVRSFSAWRKSSGR
ncbi:FAD-binding domain-containing protein [Nocardioides litoris]|uniref:FAD-binding domain-containing protein n=1 Tax=Nocardioides litoris TaxID=1926648 RepID=UPI00111EED8D|nr:FAD-binding domain-containing protein [Nocardioides litoris]